jgi:divalent metal cation (Fe/Co/Zn/Cd) transporter
MRDRPARQQHHGDGRAGLLRAAARVSALSCLVSLVIAVFALVLGSATGSLALVAFGLESVVDSAASGVLLWRFGIEARHPHRGRRLEERVSRLIGAVLVVVATYLVTASVRALISGAATRESSASIALASASVALLPWIAYRKLTLARRLGSGSLRADGVLTLGGAVLAAMTLAAILITRYVGFEAADAVAALVVAAALLWEAARTFRGSDEVLGSPDDTTG